MYHLELLVAGDGGGAPEVQFIEHRYAEDEYAVLSPRVTRVLKTCSAGMSDLLCGVLAGEVALVILVLCRAVSTPAASSSRIALVFVIVTPHISSGSSPRRPCL